MAERLGREPAIFVLLLHAWVGGCSEPADRTSAANAGAAGTSGAPGEPASIDDEPWLSEPPFSCGRSGSCEGRIAACISERFITRVSLGECTDTGGLACESDGIFHRCPDDTVCADVPGATSLTAACVVPGTTGDAGALSEYQYAGGVCGNRRLDNVESCDDGNQRSGDGCSRHCTPESGWACNAAGDACVPERGDAACSANACALGVLCLDMLEPLAQLESRQGLSCRCPSGPLPECDTLIAIGLPLPSGASECQSVAISGDGTTVVGSCSYPTDERGWGARAVKWTIAAGLELYPEGLSGARAVNEDGSMILGEDPAGPFIWTPTEVRHLGADIIGPRSISADGSVVVGGDTPGWVWTAAAGVLRLPPAIEGRRTAATLVSADGQVIVGYEWDERYFGQTLTWTVDGRVQPLRVLPEELGLADASAPIEDETTLAVDVNADGTRIVSHHISPTTRQRSVVLRSPESSRVLDLQPAPAVARALSADGTTLIGRSGPDGDAVWALEDDAAFRLALPRSASAPAPRVSLMDVSRDGRAMAGTGVPALARDVRQRAFLVLQLAAIGESLDAGRVAAPAEPAAP